MAHSITPANTQVAVRSMMSADENWRHGLLRRGFPIFGNDVHLTGNDLILCNTNNGKECLNEDLKYGDLSGYKNCSLSKVLSVVIESFIPMHYQKYVKLNISRWMLEMGFCNHGHELSSLV